MTLIDNIFIAWVQSLGGEAVIHYTISLLFLFVVVYVFYKITT